MAEARGKRSWLKLVDWRMVFVAGLPVWAIVLSLCIWQKLRGPTPAVVIIRQPISEIVPAESHSPASALTHYEPNWAHLTFVPANPPENPFRISNNLPVETKEPDAEELAQVRNGIASLFNVIVHGHELDAKPAVSIRRGEVPAGCKTYDTKIHFAKTLETAQKRASREDKLVFVLHLSGNIEEDGFT